MNLEDDLKKLFADKAAFDVPVAEDAAGTVVRGARRIRKRRRVVASAAGAVTMAAVVGVGVAVAGGGGPTGAPPAAPVLSVAGSTTPTTITNEVVPTGPAKATASGKISVPPSTQYDAPSRTTEVPTTATEPAPPARPVAFGPTGFNGVSLGMTQADAEATGLIAKNSSPAGAPGCTGYDWATIPRPAGDYALIISDSAGVVRISSPTNAVTPEGIYRGLSAEKVRATYPDGSGDESEWDAPVPGNEQARYAFVFDNGTLSYMRLDVVGSDCLG